MSNHPKIQVKQDERFLRRIGRFAKLRIATTHGPAVYVTGENLITFNLDEFSYNGVMSREQAYTLAKLLKRAVERSEATE